MHHLVVLQLGTRIGLHTNLQKPISNKLYIPKRKIKKKYNTYQKKTNITKNLLVLIKNL